jgi:hypothetical protein
VDAFGTYEVTFVTLLKGNWFLDILLSHKPFLLDRCPVSGSLVCIPRWLPVDGFKALHQALQARKQMCSYLSLVHESLQRFDLASQTDDKGNMGCITSTCKRAEQVRYLLRPFQPPRYFVFYPDYGPPWVYTLGG